MWREMKDQTNECKCSEHHSPIPMQAILSFRKTSNPSRNVKENTPLTDHLNHLIHHLNHLIRHQNHLNQIRLEDFLQSWQSNTAFFWKHCRKLGADQDSKEAEVLRSSSVLFTSIQVKMVLIQVSDVIDSNRSVTDGCQVSYEPELCTTCARIKGFSRAAVAFLLPKSLERTPFSLV